MPVSAPFQTPSLSEEHLLLPRRPKRSLDSIPSCTSSISNSVSAFTVTSSNAVSVCAALATTSLAPHPAPRPYPNPLHSPVHLLDFTNLPFQSAPGPPISSLLASSAQPPSAPAVVSYPLPAPSSAVPVAFVPDPLPAPYITVYAQQSSAVVFYQLPVPPPAWTSPCSPQLPWNLLQFRNRPRSYP